MSFNISRSVSSFVDKCVNTCAQFFSKNSDLEVRIESESPNDNIQRNKHPMHQKIKPNPIRTVAVVASSALAGTAVFLTNVSVTPINSVASNSNKSISQSELKAMVNEQSKTFDINSSAIQPSSKSTDTPKVNNILSSVNTATKESVLFINPGVKFSFGGEVASASLKDANDFVTDNWSSIVQAFWSPFNRQVFITRFSREEVDKLRSQYRDRFDGVLYDRCINKVADLTLDGWRRWQLVYGARYLVASRVEDGYGNCYFRMSNEHASYFEKVRDRKSVV